MTSDRLMTWHLAIWLDAMLQAVEFPTGVTHLNTSLANMDRDAFTLKKREGVRGRDSEKKHRQAKESSQLRKGLHTLGCSFPVR